MLILGFNFETFNNVAPVVALVISFISLFFVWRNYIFNVKNSLSKVSVVPVRDPLRFEGEHNKFGFNIYKPSFSYEDGLLLETMRSEKTKYVDEVPINKFSREGFPVKDLHHEPVYWGIKVKNKGDLATTNIVLKFTVVINRSGNVYNALNDIISSEPIEDSRHTQEITIPYLGADEEKTLYFFDIRGEFPSAFLFLDELRTQDKKFISDQVLIDHYTHPGFHFFPADTKYLLGSKEFYE